MLSKNEGCSNPLTSLLISPLTNKKSDSQISETDGSLFWVSIANQSIEPLNIKKVSLENTELMLCLKELTEAMWSAWLKCTESP